MASTALTITVGADVADAAAGFDSVSSSAKGMGDSVSTAAAQADTATGSMDGLASSTDDVASKTGIMTGAMGALAGGLSAVGLGEYGAALEGAAVATDTISGASDLMTLALESSKVQWVLSKAAALASAVQYGVTTAATWAMTAAQTALNVVMSLNPIALVVIALVALAAGLVIAFQKSENFRDAVAKAGDIAKAAFDAVVDAVVALVEWFKDLPAKASEAWGKVKDTVTGVFDAITGKVSDLVGAVAGVVGTVSGHFASMFAPIQTALGWVQDLIDKIKSIDFPDPPDWMGLGRFTAGDATGGIPFAGLPSDFFDKWGTPNPDTIGTPVFNIEIQGAIDPVNTARQIRQILANERGLYGAANWGS